MRFSCKKSTTLPRGIAWSPCNSNYTLEDVLNGNHNIKHSFVCRCGFFHIKRSINELAKDQWCDECLDDFTYLRILRYYFSPADRFEYIITILGNIAANLSFLGLFLMSMIPLGFFIFACTLIIRFTTICPIQSYINDKSSQPSYMNECIKITTFIVPKEVFITTIMIYFNLWIFLVLFGYLGYFIIFIISHCINRYFELERKKNKHGLNKV